MKKEKDLGCFCPLLPQTLFGMDESERMVQRLTKDKLSEWKTFFLSFFYPISAFLTFANVASSNFPLGTKGPPQVCYLKMICHVLLSSLIILSLLFCHCQVRKKRNKVAFSSAIFLISNGMSGSHNICQKLRIS